MPFNYRFAFSTSVGTSDDDTTFTLKFGFQY